jgi:hypothetical protein
MHSATAQTPPGSDQCFCGDYRSQHVDGTGACRVCGNSKAPYDGCRKFRFAKHAAAEELAHWNKYHGKQATA